MQIHNIHSKVRSSRISQDRENLKLVKVANQLGLSETAALLKKIINFSKNFKYHDMDLSKILDCDFSDFWA